MSIFACIGFVTLHASTSLSQSNTEVLWVAFKHDQRITAEMAISLSLVKTVLQTCKDTAKLDIAGIELPAETLKKAVDQIGGDSMTVSENKSVIEIQFSVKEMKLVPNNVKRGSLLVIKFCSQDDNSTTVQLPNIVVRGLISLFGGANLVHKQIGMEFIDALSRSGGFVFIEDCRSESRMWVYDK